MPAVSSRVCCWNWPGSCHLRPAITYSRSVVTERLRHICGLPTITVEDASAVAQAITWYEQGMDVADALHLASSAVFSGFATMDKRLLSKCNSLAGNHNILFIS